MFLLGMKEWEVTVSDLSLSSPTGPELLGVHARQDLVLGRKTNHWLYLQQQVSPNYLKKKNPILSDTETVQSFGNA